MSHKGVAYSFGCKIVEHQQKPFFLQGNYYEVGNENSHEKSWGFCGKDCYLEDDAPQTGILRMKENIHILSDDLCENYLEISLQYKPQVD